MNSPGRRPDVSLDLGFFRCGGRWPVCPRGPSRRPRRLQHGRGAAAHQARLQQRRLPRQGDRPERLQSFRCSGFEPEDYEAIVQRPRPALFPAAPGAEPVLLKATGTMPHGGGRLLDVGSEDYQTLLRWIETGRASASPGRPGWSGSLSTRRRRVFDAGHRRSRLQVTAISLRRLDARRDAPGRLPVERARHRRGEPTAAWCEAKNRSGLFAVMVRYGDQIAVFHGTVPHARRNGRVRQAWEKAHAAGRPSIGTCAPVAAAGHRAVARRPTTATFIRRAVARHLRHAAHAGRSEGLRGATRGPTSGPG